MHLLPTAEMRGCANAPGEARHWWDVGIKARSGNEDELILAMRGDRDVGWREEDLMAEDGGWCGEKDDVWRLGNATAGSRRTAVAKTPSRAGRRRRWN
jgi:hypothetical protein